MTSLEALLKEGTKVLEENPGSQVRRLASFGVCDRRKPRSLFC